MRCVFGVKRTTRNIQLNVMQMAPDRMVIFTGVRILLIGIIRIMMMDQDFRVVMMRDRVVPDHNQHDQKKQPRYEPLSHRMQRY